MSDNGSFEPPPSFAETIGSMFGFGPIMRMMNDPMMQAHMLEMMQVIMASAGANIRMEQKLDFILRQLGHDPAQFDPVGRRTGSPAALLGGYGIPGAGANPAPSGVVDNGTGETPANAADYYPHTDGVYD